MQQKSTGEPFSCFLKLFQFKQRPILRLTRQQLIASQSIGNFSPMVPCCTGEPRSKYSAYQSPMADYQVQIPQHIGHVDASLYLKMNDTFQGTHHTSCSLSGSIASLDAYRQLRKNPESNELTIKMPGCLIFYAYPLQNVLVRFDQSADHGVPKMADGHRAELPF